jgi:hypothetical protein
LPQYLEALSPRPKTSVHVSVPHLQQPFHPLQQSVENFQARSFPHLVPSQVRPSIHDSGIIPFVPYHPSMIQTPTPQQLQRISQQQAWYQQTYMPPGPPQVFSHLQPHSNTQSSPHFVSSHFPSAPYLQQILDQSSLSLTNANSKQSKIFNILPKEDRDLHLFLRLVHDFPEDKKWLTKPVHLVDHTASPSGIHVFVDFSNIWISFMEHLKLLQLRLKQRIPHQNISFDSLVLLLERHRPVTKRVLAGSYPLLPAMELAKAIGYETNILDKVYKARDVTEKQKRWQVRAALAQGYSGTAGGAMNGNISSGSGTCDPATLAIPSNTSASAANLIAATSAMPPPPTVPGLSPEKWVEQCVDELLHLKMLESLVDTDEPSTMVVATGDAAKAEYSEGFLKMIIRALKKGWKVELVAWAKSISAEYRRNPFVSQWVPSGQFRIIELDEYAEYLLDT